MRFLAVLLLTGLLSIAAASQTTDPTPAAAKPKAAASKPKSPKPAPKKTDEKTEWERALAISEPAARLGSLKKFIEAYPDSTRINEAGGMIASAAAESGNERLQAGDVTAAAELFRTAATSVPTPIPDQLFADTLSKLPANLYFRGERQAALDIAKVLEEKAAGNAQQLLSIANFYLSIEGGSEAKSVTAKVIAIEPDSAAAYETLGLAHRMDFELEESAAAYARALELAPDLLSARRGLAEMKRSLGKADEAVILYREILNRDETSVPARTGVILAMFDAGDRTGAEAELARALEASPNNIMLLTGAAYWYASRNDGAKAVELARKAIESDPRFIWSHIALARGFLALNNPVSAERTLIAARRYGNFPTLEYEIASARAAAGLYREASEELAKSFKVVDAAVQTKLGGRVARESKDISELVGYERRASIFALTAADDPENAARLTALLQFKQEMDKAEPAQEIVLGAADKFIKGDDRMMVHRQIFAATQLLEKKVALPRVIEIAKDATANVDAGLDITSASTAVMASELYESRSIAAIRNEYISVPEVPRSTLSAILRGRIEEINGWAAYQMQEPSEAVLRLKRAISVLPPNSAWWRSSTWRLGSALELAGKDAEALEMYIKSYKSSNTSDTIRYGVISAVYQRVNGSTEGLEDKINAAQTEPNQTLVAQRTDPTPTPAQPANSEAASSQPPPALPITNRRIPAVVPVASPQRAAVLATSEPTPGITPEPTPAVIVTTETPQLNPEPTPEPLPVETPAETPSATPEPTLEPTPEPTPEETPAEALPATVPSIVPSPTPEPTAEVIVPAASPETTPEPIPAAPTPEITPETTPAPRAEAPTEEPLFSTPAPETSTTPTPVPETEPTQRQSRSGLTGNELFPPIVITIPSRTAARQKPTKATAAADGITARNPDAELTESERSAQNAPSRAPTRGVVDDGARPAEIKPCALTVSEEIVRLQTGGRDVAVIVGLEDEGELDGLTAVSVSPSDVSVRREAITGVRGRALFVLRSTSEKAGLYQVLFEMPCGKRDIEVRVR